MTAQQLFIEIKKILKNSNIENYQQESDILFENIVGEHRLQIAVSKNIDTAICDTVIAMAKKRANHYPLQYICKKWQFMNIELLIGEGVLIPRSDTEIVVEYALEKIKNIEKPIVLDLCSGSGAIALSIKNELPHSNVTAIELYDEAFKYLKLNAKNDITILKENVFTYQDKIPNLTFDLIISNPPYVTKQEMEDIQQELLYEPRTALTDEEDGLNFYKHISKYYYNKIKIGGYLVFEIGANQGESVKNILQQLNYKDIAIYKDYASLNRCVIA